jgi:hypothetical protein
MSEPAAVAARHGTPAWSGVVEWGMAMTLVHSADGRALAIRDHLLPLVRDRGALETQRGAVRLVSLRIGPWAFEH